MRAGADRDGTIVRLYATHTAGEIAKLIGTRKVIVLATLRRCGVALRSKGVRPPGRAPSPRIALRSPAVRLPRTTPNEATVTQSPSLVPRICRIRQTTGARHDFFSSIDTEEKAYWLGFLSADGWIAKNTLTLRLASRDAEHVRLWRDTIAPGAEIKDRTHHRDGKATYSTETSVSSPELIRDLVKHGVTQDKETLLRPWGGPPELMRAYWRGLVCGDGWVVCDGDSPCLGLVGTVAVTEGFAAYARHLVTSKISPRPKGSVWVIEYGGRAARTLAKHLYADASLCLARKKASAEALIARSFRPPPAPFEPTEAELRAAFAECGSWLAVAKRLGVSQGVLYDRVHRLGLNVLSGRVRLIEYEGRAQSVAAWARECGLPAERLFARLKTWSVEDTLTLPVSSSPTGRSPQQLIEFGGVTRCVAEWARVLGIKDLTLRERLRTWTVEDAFTRPVDQKHSKARRPGNRHPSRREAPGDWTCQTPDCGSHGPRRTLELCRRCYIRQWMRERRVRLKAAKAQELKGLIGAPSGRR